MTVQDAMKALAEALEPFNSYKFTEDRRADSSCQFWRSPQGWWVLHIQYVDWQPVDFLHSEDASARLMDAMPPLLMAKCQLRSPGEAIQWDVQVGGNHELSDDRKTAVFLAALAWKGIERPEGLK